MLLRGMHLSVGGFVLQGHRFSFGLLMLCRCLLYFVWFGIVDISRDACEVLEEVVFKLMINPAIKEPQNTRTS
jgi:hypothetical protein